MPGAPRRPRSASGERGSAVVDFVFVLVVLLPLFFGILQLALVLHVRNTLASAASEGARYGATLDRDPADGAAYTRRQIRAALAPRYARQVTATATSIGGAPGVVVRVEARVPALGLGAIGIRLSVAGHAVDEEAS